MAVIVKSKDDEYASVSFLHCYYCGEQREVEEAGRVLDEASGDVFLTILTQCKTCSGALVFAQENIGDGWDDPARVYPDDVRVFGNAVPKDLQTEHREARKCFDAKAFTAAVVMVGRTLEGLCAAQGAKRGNLASGIKQLHDKGIIDKRLMEWADALRVVRNEGAHFTGRQVSRADAYDALRFCEAILEYIYVVTDRFEKYKARRAAQLAESAANISSAGQK